MSPWTSLHVFFHDSTRVEELLCDCVGPLARSLVASGRARRWFFIRYLEDGPHVRLRLRAPDAVSAPALEAEARARVEAWLAAHPSTRPSQPASGGAWPYPDNSVQSIPYVPETGRYGGSAALEVAEAHFQESSETVLELVARWRRSPRGAADRYLGAVQLAAMTVLSAGVPPERLSAWFADTLTHIRWPAGEPGEAYRRFLAQNRAPLAARVDRLRRLYAEDLAASPDVERWRRGTQATCAALGTALEAAPGAGWNDALRLPQKYVLVVQSYVHMTFNRLGIWAADELFLLRLLRDLTALEPVPAAPVPAAPVPPRPRSAHA